MKDWEPFQVNSLPVGSGKGADKVLGNKALWNIGTVSGSHTRVVDLPNGDRMLVRTKNGMPEFTLQKRDNTPDDFISALAVATKIDARLVDLYMTSGAYAFGALGGINNADPSLTIEPITYKSSAVAAAEASTLTPLYDKDPPSNGEVSKIYNHTLMPGALNAPKYSMYVARPSEFSGLMRRCMQGRYGVGNTSTNMVAADGQGSVLVGNTFGRTTGVLRFGNKYFLTALTSGGGGMYGHYWPLHFTNECAELMVSGYGEEIETLCLAYAYVIADEEVFLGNYDIAYGEPIAYGWSFSLTTNAATCTANEMLAYGYDRRMYRRMSLSFSYDEEADVVSCVYTTDENIDGWITPATAPIWSPSGGETVWYNERSISPSPSTSQDFPVYSFYVGDTLNVVRWKWSSASVTGNWTNHVAAYTAQSWENAAFGEGETSYDVTTHYGTVLTHGFYVAGLSQAMSSGSSYWRNASSASLSYAEPSFSQLGVLVNGCRFIAVMASKIGNSWNPRISPWASLVYLKGTNPADPRGGNHWSYYEARRSNYSITRNSETGAASHSTALVIPATDCSSVYIGTKQTLTGRSTASEGTGGLSNYSYVEEWQCAEIRDEQNNLIGYEVTGVWFPAVKKQFSIEDLASWGGSVTWNSPGAVAVNYTNFGIKLHADQGVAVGSSDSEIFYPGTFRTKLLQQVQVVSSSVYMDKRYNSGTLSGGEVQTTNMYPSDITLFVGAA